MKRLGAIITAFHLQPALEDAGVRGLRAGYERLYPMRDHANFWGATVLPWIMKCRIVPW